MSSKFTDMTEEREGRVLWDVGGVSPPARLPSSQSWQTLSTETDLTFTIIYSICLGMQSVYCFDQILEVVHSHYFMTKCIIYSHNSKIHGVEVYTLFLLFWSVLRRFSFIENIIKLLWFYPVIIKKHTIIYNTKYMQQQDIFHGWSNETDSMRYMLMHCS